jgi:hypothetical protein
MAQNECNMNLLCWVFDRKMTGPVVLDNWQLAWCVRMSSTIVSPLEKVWAFAGVQPQVFSLPLSHTSRSSPPYPFIPKRQLSAVLHPTAVELLSLPLPLPLLLPPSTNIPTTRSAFYRVAQNGRLYPELKQNQSRIKISPEIACAFPTTAECKNELDNYYSRSGCLEYYR